MPIGNKKKKGTATKNSRADKGGSLLGDIFNSKKSSGSCSGKGGNKCKVNKNTAPELTQGTKPSTVKVTTKENKPSKNSLGLYGSLSGGGGGTTPTFGVSGAVGRLFNAKLPKTASSDESSSTKVTGTPSGTDTAIGAEVKPKAFSFKGGVIKNGKKNELVNFGRKR